mmetsp:Transcript_11941/g.18430  ORF Transcript_11941/g.18430 Transcript_11941/m.18430 type:complete len:197 (-) Transcript_11941:6613-7203(-)
MAYFHLYFLHLVKTKKAMAEWSEEETKLWKKFDEKFGETQQFYEVETQLLVLNKLEQLPSTVTEDMSDAQVNQIIDVVEHIRAHYLETDPFHSIPEVPRFMTESVNQDSSQSETEDDRSHLGEKKSKLPELIPYSRSDRLKSLQAEIDQQDEFMSANFQGFEEELDWTKANVNYVYTMVTSMISRNVSDSSTFEFY